MAIWYVRSGAAGTASGASWTNAFTTLVAAMTASAAGDDIYVSEDHAETSGSAMTVAAPGTAALPTRIFCANHSGSVPPVATDLATTATVTTTGTSPITITGYLYCYGLTFSAASGNVNAGMTFLNSIAGCQIYETCNFILGSTGTTATLGFSIIGSAVASEVIWNNCTVKFGATPNAILPQACRFTWKNTTSAIAGSVFPTSLFFDAFATRSALVMVDGVDLSALTSGKSIVASGATGGLVVPHVMRMTNCKLTSGVTVCATPTSSSGLQFDLVNCDSSATNYRNERYRYQGTLLTETTIVQTSPAGASDGTTPISWKVVSTANPERYSPFDCFEIVQWVDTTGSSKTATIQCITDNVLLTNADVWVEAEYLGSSGTPMGSFVSSGPATQLTAGSSLTTSTSTWTTTGMTTPKPQQFAVSFTPQLKGWVRFVVRVSKPSITVWIDPKVTIV